MDKIIAKNPSARHNYTITETLEAGIVLTGTEIKSIRNGKVNLKDTYARIKNDEVFIINMYVAPYEEGNRFNHDERRERKLLLKKNEILKLEHEINTKKLTLIPLKIYFNKDNNDVESYIEIDDAYVNGFIKQLMKSNQEKLMIQKTGLLS